MFHGSMVALVTPMEEDGAIDVEGLRQLVEKHIAAGTDCLVVNGTTGESATLEPDEQRQVIRQVIEQTNNRVPVIAGTSAVSATKAIALSEAAMHEGVDGCLLMCPPYVKPTQEGLYQYYKTIAHAVGIPQILYNVPGRTACDLLPETVARLADISNIVGIKEATGSVERALNILYRCGDKLDVLGGDDASALALMLVGAKGVISVTANVAPKLMHDMCQSALKGNSEEAHRINRSLMALHQKLFVEGNPIPTKWALMKMGWIKSGIRLPLTKLSERYHQEVFEALKIAGVMK